MQLEHAAHPPGTRRQSLDPDVINAAWGTWWPELHHILVLGDLRDATYQLVCGPPGGAGKRIVTVRLATPTPTDAIADIRTLLEASKLTLSPACTDDLILARCRAREVVAEVVPGGVAVSSIVAGWVTDSDVWNTIDQVAALRPLAGFVRFHEPRNIGIRWRAGSPAIARIQLARHLESVDGMPVDEAWLRAHHFHSDREGRFVSADRSVRLAGGTVYAYVGRAPVSDGDWPS